jgi:hypothetical protein
MRFSAAITEAHYFFTVEIRLRIRLCAGRIPFLRPEPSNQGCPAINSDPSIFGVAHFSIAGELFQVIPELFRNLQHVVTSLPR